MPTKLRKKRNTLSSLLYLYMLYIWYINTVYIIYREILYIISIYRKITCTFLAGNWQRKNSYFAIFSNLVDLFLVLDKTDITSSILFFLKTIFTVVVPNLLLLKLWYDSRGTEQHVQFALLSKSKVQLLLPGCFC